MLFAECVIWELAHKGEVAQDLCASIKVIKSTTIIPRYSEKVDFYFILFFKKNVSFIILSNILEICEY